MDYRKRQNWAASSGQERELTGHSLKRNSIYEDRQVEAADTNKSPCHEE